MNENFITKLETNNYLIGSFDAYIDITKQLIKDNSNITDEEVEAVLKGIDAWPSTPSRIKLI